jgi:WD40 repeat protein
LNDSTYVVMMGGAPRSCVYIDNERLIFLVDEGGVWHTSDGRRLGDISASIYLPALVAFAPGGALAVTSSGRSFRDERGGLITVRHLNTGQTYDLQAHTLHLTDMSFSEDSRHLITASADATVCFWNVDNWSQAMRYTGHSGEVTCCAISPGNSLAASIAIDNTLRVWRADSGAEVLRIDVESIPGLEPSRNPFSGEEQPRRWWDVRFLRNGHVVALTGGAVVEWDRETGKFIRLLPWSASLDEFSADLHYLADFRPNEVCISDLDTGNDVAWFPWPGSSAMLMYHPNGRTWAAARDGTLYQFVMEVLP